MLLLLHIEGRSQDDHQDGSGKRTLKGCCWGGGLTWGLGGAGLQVTGLLAHWLHQRVAAADDVLPLVALDIPHPHTDAAGFGALGNREWGEVRTPPQHRGLCKTKNPWSSGGMGEHCPWLSTVSAHRTAGPSLPHCCQQQQTSAAD